MKTVSNDLFVLIKSLNKTEKGYFQKFCKAFISNGSSEYLELFDALDQLKTYNESTFLKEHKSKNFTTHYAVRKHYLQNAIYKALQQYYSSSTIDTQVRTLLNTVEILCYKGLFKQSLQLLSKAEKLSRKYDRECFLLEILDLRATITVMHLDMPSLKKLAGSIKTEVDNQIAHHQKRKRIQLISLRIIEDFQTRGDFLGLQNEHNKSFEQELKEIAASTRSNFLKVQALQTLSMLQLNARNQKERLRLREEQYKLYKNDKALIDENLNRYMGCLWALCQMYEAAGNYKKMHTHISQLRNTLAKYQLGATNYFQGTFIIGAYILELAAFQRTGNYKKGTEVVPVVAALLQKYDSLIREEHKMVFKLHFALIYFMAGRYGEAQVWVQKILNEHTRVRIDIIFASRLLNLVIQFELKNYQYLENLLSYTEKKVRGEGKANAFIATFIKKLGKQLTLLSYKPADPKKIWQELRSELSELEKDPRKRIILEMVDFTKWVDSKLLNKPLHEIYALNHKAEKV